LPEIISLPQHNSVLIPAQKCAGLNFNGLRFEQTTYKFQPYIICEHSLDLCRKAAARGLTIHTDILNNYEWPTRYAAPFHHQMITSDFILRNPRNFVFNDIGTGKSLSVLWAADYLMRLGLVRRVLISGTLSTLHAVWKQTIFEHMMYRTACILHGTPRKRAQIKEDFDFYIINHDGLKNPEFQNALKARGDIDMVIVDEGAIFRNQKTDLWSACNSVCGPETGRELTWMTGSPMPNKPTDAWAQARIVNPKTVPRYFSRFRSQTMTKLTQFKWVPTPGWETTVYTSLRPCIRYKRDECIDLPAMMVVEHKVLMSKQQKELYAKMKEDLTIEMDGGLITAANEGVKISKLLQLACGAVYSADGFQHFVDVQPKFDELKAILAETGDKLIIFAPFKHIITRLRSWFNEKMPDVTFGVVNGDVSMSARGEIFHDFQDGDLNVIIAHPKSMAHGLTLTASNTILWWGPIDDYEIYEQAIGRITRPGQLRHQYVKHLICSQAEQAVYKRCKNKESMQGLLLDMISN